MSEALVPKGLEDLVTLDRPEGKDEGLLGSEGIGREDILLPRVGLAQKTSPEIDPTQVGKYIEGLQFTDMFNSLTKQPYGKGPLHFVIIRRDNPRFIEFNPLEQGGGIKDMNVPAGDPRTLFTTGPNGERVKPAATMFYDFIVLLLTGLDPKAPLENVIGLSFKGSGLKAARKLNMLITQRGSKMLYKGVYEVRTGSEIDKKSGGGYAIYKIQNAGWLKPDSAIEQLVAEMFDVWKDKKVTVDVDATRVPGEDDVEFPPAGQAAPSDM